MYSHCLWIVTGSDYDRFAAYMGAPISTFAVDGFFFISGFLVYRSFMLKPSLGRFAAARFARVWPGLAMMVLVVISVGLLYTTSPTVPYLREAWLHYGLRNLSFFSASFRLPGISCGAEDCVLNGSLWTIPWEVRCYVLLGLLFALRLTGRRAMIGIVLPATLIFAIVYDLPVTQHYLHGMRIPGLLYVGDRMDRLWTAFALGIAAYIFRQRIAINWVIFAVLLVCNVVVNTWSPSAGLHLRTIVAGYLVLVVGFLTCENRPSWSADWPDLSYGMYIYAFPVMFALHRAGVDDLSKLFVLDVLITAVFATFSWFCVERPALDWLKTRLERHSSVFKANVEPRPAE